MTLSITGNAREFAELILAHPVQCPTWCQSLEHPLHMSDALEDCHYRHTARFKVAGSDHLVVEICDDQRIDQAYVPCPHIGLSSVGPNWDETLIDPMAPEEADALASALGALARTARDS